MARTDLPYTYVAKRKYWRFRHPAVGDVSLPGAPGEDAFHKRYAELVAVTKKLRPEQDRHRLSWLTGRYRKSPEYRLLADATQLDYEKTLTLLDAELGDQPYRLITRKMVKAVRDDYAATPRKANKIKQMVSRLYSWAEEEQLVMEGLNPASGLKHLKPKGGVKEYVVWSEAEIALMLEHAPAFMVTIILLALYTGQRAQDICRMTWTQFQGDTIRVRQSKTGALLTIACHARLQTHLSELKRRLDAEGRRGIMICSSAAGRPFNANSLSSAVGRAVRAVPDMPPDRSLHGLRYAAGAMMEEAGCTVGEIESVLGHETFKMALKYASQRLRAKAAMEKVEKGGA